MQNICLVTTQEVWTLETNNGLMYEPHTQFWAKNLSKKVQLIHKSIGYQKEFIKLTFWALTLPKAKAIWLVHFVCLFALLRANAWNVSFINYVQWQIYVINLVD